MTNKNASSSRSLKPTAKSNGKMESRDYAVKRVSQTVISTSPTDIGRAANFISLSNVPDVTDFTNLFDQFTIDSLEVHFVLPRAAISAGNSAIFPTLAFAYDPNDSTAPTTIGDVLSYDNVTVRQFSESNRQISFRIKPKMQQSLAAGAATSAVSLWCSTSTASTTPWLGFKFWLVDYNSTSTAGSVVTVYLKYHMRFRVPR